MRNTRHFCHSSSQGKKHLSLLPQQPGKETPATFATAVREINACHFCHSNQRKKCLSLLPQQLWKLPFPSTTSLLFALRSISASPLFSTALSGTSSGLCPACRQWPSKVQGWPHRSETSPKPTNLAHDAKPTNQSCRWSKSNHLIRSYDKASIRKDVFCGGQGKQTYRRTTNTTAQTQTLRK